MHIDEALTAAATLANPPSVDTFRKHIDFAWVEEALLATGTATLRRRRLPAEQVVWLVLGMALFRNRPVSEVVAKLDLALPGSRGPTVARSAVSQARRRLGSEPMQHLFERCADHWTRSSAARHAWRGLSLFGVDGTTLRLPDSDENRAHFGSQDTGGRGISGYPLARVVALMALRSHLLAAVRFGPYDTSERSYAMDLWSSVPDSALVIVDRLFVDAGALIPLHREGRERHWLVRARKNNTWRVVRRLGPKDELVEMTVSDAARSHDPSLPKTWMMRAIEHRRKGSEPKTLLTSLTDAEKWPASEIAALYHERWEIELGFDEVKTEVLAREETIRSKSPDAVRQELWGILLAYNLVRLEMMQIADEANVLPIQVSFVAALRLICDEWLWCAVASPGAIPRHLKNLRAAVSDFILPDRRSARSYPRAVKIKMSNYARKRPQPLRRRGRLSERHWV
jgi:hypothetical protein